MTAGPLWVDALRRIWDAGDAVCPLDPSAPSAHRRQLLDVLRPTAIIESDGERRSLADGMPAESGDGLVMATSGTSGAPKGVVLTRVALDASARLTSEAVGVSAESRWVACLPLHHIGGFGVVARAVLTDVALDCHRGFDAEVVVTSVDHGATHVSLVPAMCSFGEPIRGRLSRRDIERFERVLLGGSVIPTERPTNCTATYGMTETAGGIVYDGLPLDEVAIRVATSGELEVSSPTLFRGFRTGATAPIADGWWRTGDLGSMSSDGIVIVDGRADDVIISGGEKVWPAPVEAILMGLDGVADVAVVGRPDERWGQRVVALIVTASGAELERDAGPTLTTVRAAVKAVLPAACAPHSIEFVEILPRTSIGKIRRGELR